MWNLLVQLWIPAWKRALVSNCNKQLSPAPTTRADASRVLHLSYPVTVALVGNGKNRIGWGNFPPKSHFHTFCGRANDIVSVFWQFVPKQQTYSRFNIVHSAHFFFVLCSGHFYHFLLSMNYIILYKELSSPIFQSCQSVRHPWHLSRSPLYSIYKSINALYWPSIINYQLLPPHSVLNWPSTQLHHLVTHSWAN